MNDKYVVSLSEQDRKVLELIQQTVNMSAADIGTMLRLKPHVARRSIERLRHAKAIHPYVPINTAALGFCEYQVVLDSGGDIGHLTTALTKRIMEHDHVPLVIELAGKIQFSVWARSSIQFGTLLDSLIGVLPTGVVKTVIMRRWFHSFVLTFEEGMDAFGGCRLEPNKMPVTIDETDHKILRAISQINHLSSQQIGRLAELPVSTVDYRIRRLMKENVILEPRYYMNESKLGLHGLYVRLRSESPAATRERLLLAARESREISSLTEVIGPWDFEICLALRNALTTNSTLASMLHKLKGAVSVHEIVPHLGYLKICNYPFKCLV
ncbi:MAG: Lrp/AsnC family transcriptional regulator [Proteobacteria bacterium]|nr:Lrp/AsnC family transcriptional regulator [Pseudomonadota bacterium]